MLIPTNRLLWLTGIIAALALVVSFVPQTFTHWWMAVIVSCGIILVDAVSLAFPNPISIKRKLQGSIPLGVKRKVELRLTNNGKRPMELDIHDHFPTAVEAMGMPVSTRIEPKEKAELSYSITARERGKLEFPFTQLRIRSFWGFWKRNFYVAVSDATRVYPNFAAVSHVALLATDHRLSQMGIIKKRRRGEGQDFHQLREYREGDGLRQIDWKASSRTRKLISREYQDERDQEIILLLDCGQRMSAKDDELSHFDHTLNAMLLLSYVALRQGDSVGLATFGGETRWLAPHKGAHTLHALLNALYDLQPGDQSPDYTKAATELLLRQKKRALVILLTNVRDEDSDNLLPAIKLLSKKHLVLLASLREQALDQALQQPVEDLNAAIEVSALHRYLQQRQQAFEKLRANQILTVDVLPAELTAELINSYLNIKRSGQL